jgi:disulfide bond formation protein DsbB
MDPNPSRWSFRTCCLAGAAVCALLLGFALYLQFHDGLLPCPLCIFQRIAFATLGLVLLVAGLHAPRGRGGRRTWGVLALLPALAGIGLAWRHVWMQQLPPDQVPMCGPSLDFLMEAMPVTSVIRTVLTGSGECANVDWSFLGLSMPAWSLAWFVLLASWVLATMFRAPSARGGRR